MMQRHLKKVFLLQSLLALIFCFVYTEASALKPIWTFTSDPDYPPTVTVTPMSSAVIRYVITNQSNKSRTLKMKTLQGVTQGVAAGDCMPSFQLMPRQSCTLTLFVDGGALAGDVKGGPIVCDQGNSLQCYQPAASDALNISIVPIARYAITPVAGEHGIISPDTTQSVLTGDSLTFYATPDPGYLVDQWRVDGGIKQIGGGTLTLSNIVKNHTVEVTFTPTGTLYVGMQNGSVYFSNDNGLHWSSTTAPSSGQSVNGLFATPSTLYAASADGKVYYSTTNGLTWVATATVPDHSAVNGVFVASINGTPTIYTATAGGHVYYSIDGTTWSATATPGTGAVNSVFVTPTQTLYAGSRDGNVYYSTDLGAHWNTILGPNTLPSLSVQSVFVTNDALYLNTRHVSTNSTLPAGTVDFEYAYYTNSLMDSNPTWTLYSQLTYSLFVNADASLIHAGTQDGYVYSLTTGEALGFINYSPITSLFFLGQYV